MVHPFYKLACGSHDLGDDNDGDNDNDDDDANVYNNDDDDNDDLMVIPFLLQPSCKLTCASSNHFSDNP